MSPSRSFAVALRSGFRLLTRLGLAGMLGWLFLTGCASRPDPESAEEVIKPTISEENRRIASGSLAAVEIEGHSVTTIADTVQSVFTEAGFTVKSNKREVITFERPAQRRQVAAYGNWFAMEMRLRLKVEMIQQNSSRFLLVCRSYMARDAGTMAEDEQPLARRQVREYESLLYEVASRLN